MYTYDRRMLHDRAVHVYSKTNYVQQQNMVGNQIVQKTVIIC